LRVLLETPLHHTNVSQAMVIFYSQRRRHRSNSKAGFSSSSTICAPHRRRRAPHMHACRDQLARASWNQHRIEHSWPGGTSRQRCRRGARTSSNSLVSVCAAQVRRTEYLPRGMRHIYYISAQASAPPSASQIPVNPARAWHRLITARRGYGVGAGLRSMSTASTQNRYLPFGACPGTSPALVAMAPPHPLIQIQASRHRCRKGASLTLEAGQKMFSTGVAVASRAWALRSTSRSARTHGHGHGHGAPAPQEGQHSNGRPGGQAR
jgi:hypothetical protein